MAATAADCCYSCWYWLLHWLLVLLLVLLLHRLLLQLLWPSPRLTAGTAHGRQLVLVLLMSRNCCG
jgi:hypothetical protein